jgi:charged multivesicular body protein 2A
MTPAERLRKHQRALDRTQRELDRERVKLENQEKKLVQDIKKSAKNGQIGACKIQAKDLVRTRRSVYTLALLVDLELIVATRTDTFRSSIRCARNYKPSRFASRYERGYRADTHPRFYRCSPLFTNRPSEATSR